MKLKKGLYAYLWRDPYENNCNTYVIESDKTVLIDPGLSRYVDPLFG
jgi:flavorubredoxin